MSNKIEEFCSDHFHTIVIGALLLSLGTIIVLYRKNQKEFDDRVFGPIGPLKPHDNFLNEVENAVGSFTPDAPRGD